MDYFLDHLVIFSRKKHQKNEPSLRKENLNEILLLLRTRWSSWWWWSKTQEKKGIKKGEKKIKWCLLLHRHHVHQPSSYSSNDVHTKSGWLFLEVASGSTWLLHASGTIWLLIFLRRRSAKNHSDTWWWVALSFLLASLCCFMYIGSMKIVSHHTNWSWYWVVEYIDCWNYNYKNWWALPIYQQVITYTS